MVRRPVMEVSGDDDGVENQFSSLSSSSPIDAGLSNFAKKIPIFEPERVELSTGEKPLVVNLDLALYRSKVLARNFRYSEVEKILQKVSFQICLDFDLIYKYILVLPRNCVVWLKFQGN